MVEVDIQQDMSEDFIALIPDQRVHIDQLISDGTLLFFCVSLEKAKVWTTINAETAEEALAVIEAMPMRQFMVSTLYDLSFVNIAGSGLPAISLN